MLVGLARKSAAKSNEELVNQKYATPHCFLSWIPFSYKVFQIIMMFWLEIHLEIIVKWTGGDLGGVPCVFR